MPHIAELMTPKPAPSLFARMRAMDPKDRKAFLAVRARLLEENPKENPRNA